MEDANSMRIILITGLSGAGKSHAMNCFEDMGYYCVDNLPPTLIPKFVSLFVQSEGRSKKIAMVCDMRGGVFFEDLFETLKELGQCNIDYEILFLTADDEVLIRRFKETRRRHPLGEASLPAAIQKERKVLSELRGKADQEIDTTNLKSWELKARIVQLYEPEMREKNMQILIISFGFKYGLPLDADLVFDVRFLPNPYYVEHLKPLSGEDSRVKEYLWRWEETGKYFDKVKDLIAFTIPFYVKEGKANLVIAIGCTGGKHRSVVLADELARVFGSSFNLAVEHRDIYKS
ncbi:MAG TPA: RNase adapter RapZ [Candidatus Limnocylindrales bacterium]|nr:RNase adapter RapZ [Candidatus Limnocylindrales bacterium]